MSSTENTYTIVGNLTADPDLAFTQAGSPYARFTIAHTPRRYDRDTGQWVDGEPLFMRAVAWRQLAEHVGESLTKGTRVVATGQLRQSSWETPDTGEKRTSIELHVDEIGPSLRFATARVAKATRSGLPEPADPWATTSGSAGAGPWAASASGQQQPAAVTAAAGAGGVPGFTDTASASGDTEGLRPPF